MMVLGKGQKINLSLPVLTKTFVNIDLFSDVELRYIQYNYNELNANTFNNNSLKGPLPNIENSSIYSGKYGITFDLPIEGEMILQRKDHEKYEYSTKVLQHRMNWFITFSSRPFVERIGNYGKLKNQYNKSEENNIFKEDKNAPNLTYFISDEPQRIIQQTINEENCMFPHKKIIFQTEHNWFLLTREKNKNNITYS